MKFHKKATDSPLLSKDEIARRLREGETYRSIQRDLRVSVKTVAKVKSAISDE